MSTVNISDTSFLGHVVDNKIMSKMAELKEKDKGNKDNEKSFLDITESNIDGKHSFLNFTIDKGILMNKRGYHRYANVKEGKRK